MPEGDPVQPDTTREAGTAADVTLRTPRLTLRRLRREDAAALCSYRSLPEVAKHQSWESFGPEDAAKLIEAQFAAQPNLPGTWLQLAIVVSDTGEMVGDCGLHCLRAEPAQMELGITLSPAHQGRGYAAEAVGAMVDYAFGVLGKHRVTAVTEAENHAAAAVLERLGFRREAHFVEHVWFKGKWASDFVFAMLRREWEERRKA